VKSWSLHFAGDWARFGDLRMERKRGAEAVEHRLRRVGAHGAKSPPVLCQGAVGSGWEAE
jgi:hypothetical protein